MNNTSVLSTFDTTQFPFDIDSDRAKELATAQWNGIKELGGKYDKKKVPGTTNLFEDSKWLNESDAHRYESSHDLDWSLFDALESPARILICKIFAYKQISVNGIAASTLRAKLFTVNSLFRHLNQTGILHGDFNTPLLGMNYVTRENIEEFIDNYLASGITSKTGGSAATALSELSSTLDEFKDTYSFLHLGNVLPWELDKKIPFQWIKQRMTDLGLVDRDKKPFKALGNETASHLVERSMDILDNYADLAVEIIEEGELFGKTNDKGSPKARYSDKQRRHHAKKYAGAFDAIVPMELYEDGTVRESFYGNLFRIIQGAMLNILLFTSGLRNSDIRNLRIGQCVSSDAKDHLFYITATLQKTGNDIHIPVPEQTFRAFKILEKLRFEDSPFLFARYAVTLLRDKDSKNIIPTRDEYLNAYKRNLTGAMINNLLVNFASHFDIPFVDDDGNSDDEATAHRYRATTAGWLASASNLSVLLVRRLFGHTNNLMPLEYLHHNHNFVAALEEITEEAHNQVATNLTNAVASKKIGGAKGIQLLNGFEYQKGKSQSLSEAQLMISFRDQLKERLDSGQLCGFITPLAVICGRNPNDTSPTPCAKKCYKNQTAELAFNNELMDHLSMIRPDHCIGNKCEEAIVGEWSTALRDSFIWYAQLLNGVHGDYFTEEHYKEEAKLFIRQYADDMKVVFNLEADNV